MIHFVQRVLFEIRSGAFATFLLMGMSLMAADGVWSPVNPFYGINGLKWSKTALWKDGVKADGGLFLYESAATFANNPPWYLASTYVDVEGVTLSGIRLTGSPLFIFDGMYPLTFVGEESVMDSDGFSDMNRKIEQRIPFEGTGVFIRRGGGILSLATNGIYRGFSKVIFQNGSVETKAVSGTAVSDGPVRFDGVGLTFQPQSGETNDVEVSLASAGGVELRGSVGFQFDQTTHHRLSVNLGAITRDPVLNPGTLQLTDVNNTSSIGDALQVRIANASEWMDSAAGMMAPFLVCGKDLVSFVRYDAERGVVPLDEGVYKSGFEGAGEHDIVRLTASTTLTADAHIHALILEGDTQLTIADGVTLTVGDGVNPAGIIIQGYSTPIESISGGNLDFRGSEGIFWVPETASVNTVNLNTTIKGSAGITFTARNKSNIMVLNVAGTYSNSGDIRCYWGRLNLNAELSAGQKLFLFGDWVRGAQLFSLPSTGVIRELHVAGSGIGDSHGDSVLSCNIPTVQKLVLDDDAWRRTGSAFTGNAEISGPGKLLLKAFSKQEQRDTEFRTVNSFTGGIDHRDGTLILSTNGTFGVGEVFSSRSIVIDKTNDFVIVNALLGGAVLTNKNPVTLCFSHSKLQLSGIKTEGDLEIASDEARLGRVEQLSPFQCTLKPMEDVSTTNVTAILGNDEDFYYYGIVSDNRTKSIGLVKTGAGTISLTRPQAYSGDTEIREGTLRLFQEEVPCFASLLYHLDATDVNSIVTNEEGRVLEWRDPTSGIVFSSMDAVTQPPSFSLSAEGINGMPAVYFDGWTNRLTSVQKCATKTVILFFRTMGNAVSGEGMDCLWANKAGDWGSRFLRFESKSSLGYGSSGNPFHYVHAQEDLSMNGVVGRSTFVQGDPVLLSALAGESPAITAEQNVIGNNYRGRSLCGYVGEVLAFDRRLSAAEIQRVENYVWRKWMQKTLHSDVTEPKGALPEATHLIVNGGTFDLNGHSQTIAFLGGENGRVVNSAAETSTLTVTGGSAFNGTIGAGVTLVHAGDARSNLRVDSSASVFSNGNITLSAYRETPPTNGLSYWLDATDPVTVSVTNGRVVRWISKAGVVKGFNAIRPDWATSETEVYPTYDATIHSLPAVSFNAQTTDFFEADTSSEVQTLVMVFQSYSNSIANSGLWAYSGADMGLRGTQSALRYEDIGSCFMGAKAYFDETPVTTGSFHWTVGDTVIICLEGRSRLSGHSRIGGYFSPRATDTRLFKGAIGEVLAWNRPLTEAELVRLTSYLQKKWKGKGIDAFEEVFSADTTVSFSGNVSVSGASSYTFSHLAGGADFGVADLFLNGEVIIYPDAAGNTIPLRTSGHILVGADATLRVEGKLPEQVDSSTSRQSLVIADHGIEGEFRSVSVPAPWKVKSAPDSVSIYRIYSTLLMLR